MKHKRGPAATITPELGERVRTMTRYQVPQAEIVRRTGLSQSSVSRIQRGLVAAAIALAPVASEAHDQWADGSPVPAWVKASCCGPAEAHRLDPASVHEGSCNGRVCYHVDGFKQTIKYDAVLPSQDGDYWIFTRCPDEACTVHCFFVPMAL